ncbi:MAG: purine/pyrimidine permease [Anaerolineales bacterium]|nr:purine/pyrimidine permease [Anaerolineales bacterium]
MGNAEGQSTLALVYGPNERSRSIRDTILYSLQWLLIMFYPVVWGYAIVGIGLGLEGAELSGYMTRIVLMIGIATLVQAAWGHRLAMVSGPNIIPSLAIVAAFVVGGKEYALHSFNAYIIAGVIVALIGGIGWISQIGKVWTPLVLGSMVMMVGLATSSVGMGLIASSGATWPFYVGVLLALSCGWLSIKGRGMLATIPVMIVIVAGYAIFMITGKFDWGLVKAMPTLIMPTLFPFGMTMPPVDLIITMVIVNMFAAVNLYGNVQGYTGIIGAKMDRGREKRYFTFFGLVEGALAGMLGVPSHVSYGENLGLVLLTRVAARFFIMIASVVFIGLSFFGQVGGLMAAMPQPVAGAVLLGVASTLIGIGANVWHQREGFATREIFICGFSVFFALGVSVLPQGFFDQMPRLIGMVFKNSVIMVIITAIVMEQILFRKNTMAAQAAATEEEGESRQ